MPTKPEPPITLIALLAQIVRDHRQTRHAAILVFSLAFAVTVVLAPVIVVLVLFGETGAAAIGGASALTAAGIAAHRAVAARRSQRGTR
jgi:hypothetical protein